MGRNDRVRCASNNHLFALSPAKWRKQVYRVYLNERTDVCRRVWNYVRVKKVVLRIYETSSRTFILGNNLSLLCGTTSFHTQPANHHYCHMPMEREEDIKQQVLQSTLKEVQNTNSAGDVSADPCVICLESVTGKAFAIPCRHESFDFICLANWLEEKSTCPLCT